ncbi:MAG TPA: DUF2911 domain-containing protein [Thermoanaerobaculaceae bacterium]|nr:DUF2911 domain-containing protein [Thermoanaerobaculaceae bacterium]
MGIRVHSFAFIAATALTAGAAFAPAQVPLTLPQVSQKATVSQTIGLTEIAVTCHRPAVKGRAIWGGLVPYGKVWRAGANENTTISFTSPVTVGGKELPAGTYGLHVLPTEHEWTFILSNVSWAWGSFTYDPAEDAVRVAATPAAAPFLEHLEYTLDAPGRDRVLVTLHWENRQASFPVEVKTDDVVLASIRRELRSLPRFSWQGWDQAAQYCAQNKVDLDEGLTWADRSLSMNENMTNLMTKAALLEAKGDAAQAATLRAKGLGIGNETQVNQYGYQLLGAGKVGDAIAVFAKNVKDHPQSWNVYDSLAEAQAAKGDTAAAIANYAKARSMAPAAQYDRIDGELAKLRKK